MVRAITFLLAMLLFDVQAFPQVPPGAPYDSAKHPNPIVTYVNRGDFKPATYNEAKDLSDIELLGLSQSEGKREAIEVAQTSVKRARIMGRDIDVTYYPVVRQTFTLSRGGPFVLHSFKFPKLPIPPQAAEEVLNQAAFTKTKKPEEARFGKADAPEMLDIRGSHALLFDQDGELTIFWMEEGVAYTATARIPQKELFRLVEDLL